VEGAQASQSSQTTLKGKSEPNLCSSSQSRATPSKTKSPQILTGIFSANVLYSPLVSICLFMWLDALARIRKIRYGGGQVTPSCWGSSPRSARHFQYFSKNPDILCFYIIAKYLSKLCKRFPLSSGRGDLLYSPSISLSGAS